MTNTPMDEEALTEVVTAIADTERIPAEDLDFTLYEYIDPDVLLKLAAMDRGVWELSFQIADHQIRLTHEGELFVDGVRQRRGLGQ